MVDNPTEAAASPVDLPSDSGSPAASDSSDSDQMQDTEDTLPKTIGEWEEYESAHVKRTGPPGFRFLQVLAKLEKKALKEQEVSYFIIW